VLNVSGWIYKIFIKANVAQLQTSLRLVVLTRKHFARHTTQRVYTDSVRCWLCIETVFLTNCHTTLDRSVFDDPLSKSQDSSSLNQDCLFCFWEQQTWVMGCNRNWQILYLLADSNILHVDTIFFISGQEFHPKWDMSQRCVSS